MSNADIHGRIRVKFALHEVFDDTSGTNENGINWLRKYVEKNMHTVEGMSLKVHFGNDEKTIALGHGFLEAEDGEPRFESEIIGNFNSANAKIEKINSSKGEVNALTAWATIDSFMYSKFTEYLKKEMSEGNTVDSSVEIMSAKKNDTIKYLNGWNQENRTPISYVYGGHAILGIRPADEVAVLLEVAEARKQKESSKNTDFNELRQKISALNIKPNKKVSAKPEINSKKEENILDENMIKAFDELKADIKSAIAELNNSENEKLVTEINDLKTALDESKATVGQLKAMLDEAQTECTRLQNDMQVNEEKQEELTKAIAAKELENQVMALNSAVKDNGFTEEDLALADEMVAKFKENPKSVEVNAIIATIKAKQYDKLKAELDAKAPTVEENSYRYANTLGDIFSALDIKAAKPEYDGSIY